MTLSVNNTRPSGDDDNDGRAPQTDDPDEIEEAYSGLSFRRPHIFNRAEEAMWDIEQMHLCAFEVDA